MVFFVFLKLLFFAAPRAKPVVAVVRRVAYRPPLAAEAAGEMADLLIKIERFFFLLFSEHSRTIVPSPAPRATPDPFQHPSRHSNILKNVGMLFLGCFFADAA